MVSVGSSGGRAQRGVVLSTGGPLAACKNKQGPDLSHPPSQPPAPLTLDLPPPERAVRPLRAVRAVHAALEPRGVCGAPQLARVVGVDAHILLLKLGALHVKHALARAGPHEREHVAVARLLQREQHERRAEDGAAAAAEAAVVVGAALALEAAQRVGEAVLCCWRCRTGVR